MKITEEQVEKNLEYLTSTDLDEAVSKVEKLRLEKMEKNIIGKLKRDRFNNYKSDVEKTTQAYASDEYEQGVKDVCDATLEYETLNNKRNTAEHYDSMYQSMIKRGAV